MRQREHRSEQLRRLRYRVRDGQFVRGRIVRAVVSWPTVPAGGHVLCERLLEHERGPQQLWWMRQRVRTAARDLRELQRGVVRLLQLSGRFRRLRRHPHQRMRDEPHE